MDGGDVRSPAMNRGLEGWLAAGVGLAMYTVLVTLPGRVLLYDSLHLFRIYTAAGAMLLLSLGLATQQRWARWSALGAAWVVVLNLAWWTHDHWPTRFGGERAWMAIGASLVLVLLGSPFTRRRFEPEWTTPLHRSYRWAAIGVALCLTHAATAAVFAYMDRTTGPMVTALLMFAALLLLSVGKVVGLPMAVVALVAHGLSSTYEIPRVSAFGPENDAATWFYFVGRASHFTWAPALCAAVAATLHAAPHVSRRLGAGPAGVAMGLTLGVATIGGATAVHGQWRQYRDEHVRRVRQLRPELSVYGGWSLDALPSPPPLRPASERWVADAAKEALRLDFPEGGLVAILRSWRPSSSLKARKRVINGPTMREPLRAVAQLEAGLWCGWSQTRIYHSDDAGESWWVVAELPGPIHQLAFLDSNNAVAELEGGWFRSSNAGLGWAPSHNLDWEWLEFLAAQDGRRLGLSDLCPGSRLTKLAVNEPDEEQLQSTSHLLIEWDGERAEISGRLRDLGPVEEEASEQQGFEMVRTILAAAAYRPQDPEGSLEPSEYTQLRWRCGGAEHRVSFASPELRIDSSYVVHEQGKGSAPGRNVRMVAERILLDLLDP
jgi:hypothetical protein